MKYFLLIYIYVIVYINLEWICPEIREIKKAKLNNSVTIVKKTPAIPKIPHE